MSRRLIPPAKGEHMTDRTIQAIGSARKFLAKLPSYDQARVDYVSPIDHAHTFAEALVELAAECRELRERAENAETLLKAPEVHWECQQKLNERDEHLEMAYQMLDKIAAPNPTNPDDDDKLTGWFTPDANRVRMIGAKLAVHRRWEASRK